MPVRGTVDLYQVRDGFVDVFDVLAVEGALHEDRPAQVTALRGAGWTYEAIGEAFGFTRERARQIAVVDKRRRLKTPKRCPAPDLVDLLRLSGTYGQSVLDVIATPSAAPAA